jgi:hypothetical protein
MTRINIARILVVTGFAIGLTSLSATFSHIGDPNYLLPPDYENGQAHAWYHALREAVGDVAAMGVVLFVFFGRPQIRNPGTWWICLMLLVGYYAPYWVGMPFNSALAAPSLTVEVSHVLQALAAVSGVFVAQGEFLSGKHLLEGGS